MKIALFCSSRNIVSNKRSGGIEQPIFYLSRELAKRKHRVTLYAARGSKIPGVKIKEISPFATFKKQKYFNIQERISSFYDLMALSDFFKNEADEFDVIDFNSYMFYEVLPFVKFTKKPVVVTIHYPHDLMYPYIKDNLKKIKNIHYLPVSKFIKSAMSGLKYLKPGYLGIDLDDFKFEKKPGKYLLFIGRICHEKGAHLAIQVAKKSGKKLIIAGRPTRDQDDQYFEEYINPNLGRDIRYVGEVGFRDKIKLYQGAMATLFPILWDEPFGNVLIESMACGTPVIAFDKAAVREIIKDKFSGFLVKDIGGMTRSINKITEIDRKNVRKWTQDNFSLDSMVDKRIELYNELNKLNEQKNN